MKLLFYIALEKVFKDTEGNYYTSGNFTKEVWNRYLSVCDELHVVVTDGGKILERSDAEQKKEKIDTELINVHIIPHGYSSVKSFLCIKRIRQTAAVTKKLLDECDFAIIRPANSRFIKTCRRAGKPYSIEVVGCPWDAFWNHSIKGKVLAPFMYFYSRHEVKKAKWVLYVTRQFLQKRYPTKGKTVCCSNVSLYHQNDTVLEDRINKIKYHNGKIILGTAAALDARYKGQQYVIKALSKMRKMGRDNFEYQLVGAGNSTYLQMTAKKYGVEEKLKILGQIKHEKVFEWLKTIDIYVQPSLQEGLPRSVIEAMGCGLPCIGTRVAGLPEILNEEMLFSCKKSSEIANILRRLDKEKMICLAKENFEEAKCFYIKILDKRRYEFYYQFKESVEKGIVR